MTFYGGECKRQPVMTLTGAAAEISLLVVPCTTSAALAVMILRQAARFGWEHTFSPIITPDEVTHGKPHPESMELLQTLTGLAAQDILMVGDTPFDLDMARAAGVPSLAVGHGFYGQEALAACGPRAYAPDTAALRDILLAWTA